MQNSLFPTLITFNKDEINYYINQLVIQITDRHIQNIQNLIFIGLDDHSKYIATRIAKKIIQHYKQTIPVGKIDPSLYLPKPSDNNFISFQNAEIPCRIHNKTVILFDSILHTGAHCLAALHALADIETTQNIELACLIDRGHRKFPVFATYCSKQIQSSISDQFQLKLMEIDGEDKLITIP